MVNKNLRIRKIGRLARKSNGQEGMEKALQMLDVMGLHGLLYSLFNHILKLKLCLIIICISGHELSALNSLIAILSIHLTYIVIFPIHSVNDIVAR